LPRLSNWTDIDALRSEPGVLVRFATTPEELADADLVMLPGTRQTVADLAWLRSRGLDVALQRRERPVLGYGYRWFWFDDLEPGDYPVILGTVLVLGATVSVMNLIVDLLYPMLDPRIGAP
jgi:hypothetical protein